MTAEDRHRRYPTGDVIDPAQDERDARRRPTTDWTPSEPAEVLAIFSAMLQDATGDGAAKRQTGEKPSWKVDPGHETAIFSHLWKWKNGEMADPDSGAHPLVHLAWRALAIAYQETGGLQHASKYRKGQGIVQDATTPPRIAAPASDPETRAETAPRFQEGSWGLQPGLSITPGQEAVLRAARRGEWRKPEPSPDVPSPMRPPRASIVREVRRALRRRA